MEMTPGLFNIQLAFSKHRIKVDSSARPGRVGKGERVLGSVHGQRHLHTLSFAITEQKAPFEVITQLSVVGENVYSRRTYLSRSYGGGWVDRLRRVELLEDGVVVAWRDEDVDTKTSRKYDYHVVVPFVGYLAPSSNLEVRLVIETNMEIPAAIKNNAFPWVRDDRWSVVVYGGDVRIDKFAWARERPASEASPPAQTA